MSVTASGPDQDRADVELRIPADGAYVSVLRTTTAGLAARLDFTIDDIEDLRIAVGEASAMVLPEADPDSELLCRFWLHPGRMTVSVSVASAAPAAPDEDSFAWQVLTTLASSASVQSADGRFGVTMTMKALDLGTDLEAALGAGL
ncbi:anti-sigma factor [Nocardioides sp. Arc9.136]|uniref:anti-sigma factor n=1 Tax=Nocardioides sp. Arc9.136 TaxID=2996826 RepID=UPI0026656DA2|nr:anti-sigma factor [Nocardioides sp. Arc9.136]WKN47363.1 anti-sigma factor [Nocardioides sp. Arc9.136]